jgi:hypothetical protein
MSSGSGRHLESGEAATLPSAGTSTPAEERLARLELSLVTEPGHPRLADLVATVGPVEARERIREGGDAIPPAWQAAMSRDVARRAEDLLREAEAADHR